MNNDTFLPVSEINSHYRVGPLRDFILMCQCACR